MATLGLLALVACGDSSVTPVDASVPDAAGPDGAGDAGMDAVPEAEAAAPDAGPDAAPTPPWAAPLDDEYMDGVAADAAQNTVIAGCTPTSARLTKLDPTGALVWDKTLGSTTSNCQNNFFAVAVDPSGNVYAAGRVDQTTDLGGGNTVGKGDFVVKYDPAGAFQWAYGPFPDANARLLKLAFRSNGDLVGVGQLLGSVDLGGGTLISAGMADVVLLELTPSGVFVRSQRWGDAGQQFPTALAADTNGAVFIAGRFSGQIDFGGGPLIGPTPGTSSLNVFLVKLDANGGYLHQLDAKTSSTEGRIDALATTANGSLYVGGLVNTDATLDLGGGALTSAGGTDILVGMLDGNLGHVWSKSLGDAYGQNATAVVVDSNGAATFAGGYGGTAALDLGAGPLPTPDGIFLVRLDATGKVVASLGTGSGSVSSAYPYGLAYLGGSDFALGGSYFGPVNLPSGTLTVMNGSHTFAARLSL